VGLKEFVGEPNVFAFSFADRPAILLPVAIEDLHVVPPYVPAEKIRSLRSVETATLRPAVSAEGGLRSHIGEEVPAHGCCPLVVRLDFALGVSRKGKSS
jgi:hypothetical protein